MHDEEWAKLKEVMKEGEDEIKRRAEAATQKVEMLKAARPDNSAIDASLNEEIKWEELPSKTLETIEKDGEDAEGIPPAEAPKPEGAAKEGEATNSEEKKEEAA